MKRITRRGRYEVYTRRDLNDSERPLATRLLKAAIILSMVVILLVFHKPLIDELSVIWPYR